MSIGDFVELEASQLGSRGSRVYNVGTAAAQILPGEPVTRTITGSTVIRMYGMAATTGIAQPVVGTDYVVGIAQSTSTNTTSAAGTVNVLPVNSGITFLANPTVGTSWDTQAEYDALVGKRVLIDLGVLASGQYSVLGVDGTTNGLVIMPLDISKYPGKVAVAFRQGLSDVN